MWEISTCSKEYDDCLFFRVYVRQHECHQKLMSLSAHSSLRRSGTTTPQVSSNWSMHSCGTVWMTSLRIHKAHSAYQEYANVRESMNCKRNDLSYKCQWMGCKRYILLYSLSCFLVYYRARTSDPLAYCILFFFDICHLSSRCTFGTNTKSE